MNKLSYDPKHATTELGLFGERVLPPGQAEKAIAALVQIQQRLQIMLGSAVVLSDGEWVTGYQIKTGALHAILGIMSDAGHPVTIPRPPPAPKGGSMSDPVSNLQVAVREECGIDLERDAAAVMVAGAARGALRMVQDAARYRWLRDKDCHIAVLGGEELDAAIDAAKESA